MNLEHLNVGDQIAIDRSFGIGADILTIVRLTKTRFTAADPRGEESVYMRRSGYRVGAARNAFPVTARLVTTKDLRDNARHNALSITRKLLSAIETPRIQAYDHTVTQHLADDLDRALDTIAHYEKQMSTEA